MAEELAGKVAIVTGGASGIGRATAELFVKEGARVVIADVNAEAGEEITKCLGDAAVFKQVDVSDSDQMQQLIEYAVTHFGGLQVMFNNAGVSGGKVGPFIDADLKEFERVMAVNLFGVMVGSQHAARHMRDNGGGSIINTTSIAALKPGVGLVSYRAAKAGVVQFSKSITIEFGKYGIRVNCIAPGLIPTGITNYDLADFRRRMQPLNRAGTPLDVANAALYLASDRAAQVTGTVVTVDGGASVGMPNNPAIESAGGSDQNS